MRSRTFLLVFTALAAGAGRNAGAQCSSLTTTFASNGGGSAGGQIFFDLDVLVSPGLLFTEIDVNLGAPVGTPFTLDVYLVAGGYAAQHANPAAWTLASSGGGVAAGIDQPSAVDVADFALPPGVHGVAFVANGAGHRYTNGTNTNQVYVNSELKLTAGGAKNVPWTGLLFTPRVVDATLRYGCAPVSYCTAGTTTNGCNASMGASGTPSASATSGFTLTSSNVEGQKTGLIFYGLSGQIAVPWGSGSTSFLCVKPPTQRTPVQPSGGTLGGCDGALALDFLAWTSASPGALGTPISSGQTFQAQAWFRDPPAIKTSNLSDALEFTLSP
jgi:hypothetical protein